MVFGKFCVYTAGPNTALVKSSGRREVRIVIGGRILAVPIIQRVDSLSLELRTITVKTVRGTTKNGVAVDVTSCCQVKIQGWSLARDGDDPMHNTDVANGDLKIDKLAIRLAAQHFIGKKDSEIEDAIQKTIAGHQRSIIGVLTVEELYRDRAAFSRKVLDLISEDMRHMGLTVVSYTVAEITDENGYIEALGVTQTEKVKREATEGKAEHQSHALTRKAQEESVAHMAVNEQKQLTIESDKKRQIAHYEAQQEIDREQARQQKAGLITHEERNAVLFVTRQKALAAEAKAELDVLQQNVHKQRLTMEKEVHAKADAMLYKAKVDAEGVRASAEAEAYRIREIGQAEAASIKARGQAEIDVLRSRVKVWEEQYVTCPFYSARLAGRDAATALFVSNAFSFTLFCSLTVATNRRFWNRWWQCCRGWRRRWPGRSQRRKRWCSSGRAGAAAAAGRRSSRARWSGSWPKCRKRCAR